MPSIEVLRRAPWRGPDRSAAMAPGADLPKEAYAAALATIPGIGPKTLRALLDGHDAPLAWESLVSGRVRLQSPDRSRAALAHARQTDVRRVWETHVRAGVRVLLRGGSGYPRILTGDPQAPAALFALGRPEVLDEAPRVAIVGTRSATRYGLGMAAQLGAELSAAGIVVVSGLALGIDGAAHEGAVAAWRVGGGEGRRPAPPVGVVAGSLATPYPRQHAGLWRRIAEAGAVVSECPIGAADLAWRFPLRNRIIAALSDVVVVVESHARGGALHTVQAATARGVPVGAVPGSVRSPASAGTNALLADGCFVVRDASDVLAAVGLASVAATGTAGEPTQAPASGSGLPSPTREVLGAVGFDPVSLEDILEQTRLGMDVVCAALERLGAAGLVRGEGGTWERA